MNLPVRTPPALVLFITTVSAFVIAFSSSSVNVALPPIGTEFQLGGVVLNWIATAFLLTSAALVLPLGRLGDLHGRQRIFFFGMVLFALLSAASALVPDVGWLLAARALTGVGAAMSFGTVTAVLVAAYPPEQRGRILGINVAFVYIGVSAGPVIGGLLVQALGWRSLFWAHALLGLVVVVLMAVWLRGDDRHAHEGKFDVAGSVLYAVGLSVLLVGFSNLPQLLGIGLTVAGLALLGWFLAFESRSASPIVPVTLFTKNRTFAFSNLAAMISYSATFAVAFFLSLHLEVVLGLSPGITGAILITQPLVQAIASPLAGRLSDRVAPGLLASAGMGLTVLGLAVLAFLDQNTLMAWILVAQVLLGLGFGLFSSPNTNSIMGAVEKKDLGLASATVSTMRMVGQMLSMGLALVLLSVFLGNQPVAVAVPAFLIAQHWGFGISAVLCLVGILASQARGPASQKA